LGVKKEKAVSVPRPSTKNRQHDSTSPTTSLEGRLEKIAFYNPDDHFVIARFKPSGSGSLITILGHMPEPSVGESLSINGTWRTHPRYGQQFRIDGYRVILPSDIDGIRKYLQSGMIRGVGARTVAGLFTGQWPESVLWRPHLQTLWDPGSGYASK
jgi:hypothetical protein